MKKMKARSTIEKELRKCRRIFAIRSTGLGEIYENELYGVQQALTKKVLDNETKKCKACKRNMQ